VAETNWIQTVQNRFFGPTQPKGNEKEWIPTVVGKACFRLYSPKKAFFDRTWVLPDIEKAK